MKVKDNYTNEQAVDDYNQHAPSTSYAVTLGDTILLASEEEGMRLIDKWELWQLWNSNKKGKA